MNVVIALGGNALLRRGESFSVEAQHDNARRAARAVAAIASAHRVVVTHGNGPQVGLLALQSAAFHPQRPEPLDVLGAESEGMIGYVLELELRNCMAATSIVTLLAQTVVDPADSAFAQPTKFVGPQYEPEQARRLQAERGWHMAKDGARLRRVVPSPRPQRILEVAPIRTLMEAGVLVISAGGGGVPVCEQADGTLVGVEAVVDKDLASALLARELGADMLLMLTDVDAVYRDWGSAEARPMREATPAGLRAQDFAAGSMGPKVEAACLFAEGGGRAAIGALDQAEAVLHGSAGTQIANP